MEKYKQLEQLKQQITTIRESDDVEQQWFIKHASSQETRQFIQNQKRLTHSELQILSDLTHNVNDTPFKQLQIESTLSQGMLSRYVNRLATQSLIKKYHPADNKKTVFLHPTKIGYELGALHIELHQKIKEKENRILVDYTDADVANMVHLVTKLINARKQL